MNRCFVWMQKGHDSEADPRCFLRTRILSTDACYQKNSPFLESLSLAIERDSETWVRISPIRIPRPGEIWELFERHGASGRNDVFVLTRTLRSSSLSGAMNSLISSLYIQYFDPLPTSHFPSDRLQFSGYLQGLIRLPSDPQDLIIETFEVLWEVVEALQ